MKHVPIRMCVVCRQRFAQKELNKFKKNLEISTFGRSFYVCNWCMKKDEKNLQQAVRGLIKKTQTLKEKFVNGQSENQ